ncbi:MAG TPA: ABC transporter permease, partial [Lactobacillus sp.]|nr:ABC transporter permease [Lactobacillus sp.]
MQEVTPLTQQPKKRTRRSVNWLKVLPWIVPLAVLIGWQAVVSFNWVTSSLIPAPTTVIQDGITLWQNGELPKNIAISLYRATAGFAIGGSVGFVLG